ncbi:MAG: hypothetical protein ACRC3H_11060 [Lachnospiraceae bacterium]
MKRLNVILLCFMLTITLAACNRKSSDSESANIPEEQSDQGENAASADEEKRMYITELQLSDDEKGIWELFTNGSTSNIYSYTADDQIKSVILKCYQLNDDLSWLEVSEALLKVETIEGLLVFSVNNGIEMINKNANSMTVSNSDDYSLEGSISIGWKNEGDITYDEEITIGIMASVNDDRNVPDTCKLENFNEPENLKEYDDVIVFTAYFSSF